MASIFVLSQTIRSDMQNIDDECVLMDDCMGSLVHEIISKKEVKLQAEVPKAEQLHTNNMMGINRKYFMLQNKKGG